MTEATADATGGRVTPDLFARYADDIEVGDSFTTKGRTITEADLVNFAALTWDTYPLHVDAEWASKTMFGERIAHGMLVLSYAAGLVPMQPGPIVAFYGMEKVRFFAPTKIGDTIHVHAELKEKQDRDEQLCLATFHNSIVNQREETVAKSINKVVLNRRPPA
jgi:3-hydroxybutyryl-CoA dehydratase